jgi:indolepyruvate ferredoxin oxidoreductase
VLNRMMAQLPTPQPAPLDADGYALLVTGIGGTGVLTVGAVLGMAAHLEGKAAGMIDMVGLAQKNGAVVTHLKIAAKPEDIAAVRIAAGGADLIIGCDLVTAASERVLATASASRTSGVINTHEAMPAQFTRNADLKIPGEQLLMKIAARGKEQGIHAVEATHIATALLGDSIATNLFVVGYAYQLGLIPLSAAAIEEAIRLNGAAIKMNVAAFLWGRRAAHDLKAVEAILAPREGVKPVETLDDLINGRAAILSEYQNTAYADRYRQFVAVVRARENAVAPGSSVLTTAVARYLYKLMAYKDEYEVARLYADDAYAKALGSRFKGGRLTFHLAPPILARRDPATGLPRKMTFGPWMMSVFKTLAKFKVLRGTLFDPFGRTPERKRERALIGEYRATIERLLPKLAAENIAAAAEIASIPDLIRGYGHVKERHLVAAKAREAELLARFDTAPASPIKPALAAE